MQERGWTQRAVKKALRQARSGDATFEDSEVLGSMCTAPHPMARFAHDLFLETNLGDPGHFPGAAQLEKDIEDDLKALFHAPHGALQLLTGGTEANLQAMYLAREITGRKQVVVPEHAHFSFEKAARLLGMELVWVPSGADGRADVRAMSKAIGRKTALVVGVAGSTELGLVDDIEALASQVEAHENVRFHVDAAFGGYVLPFLSEATPFDFRVPGVDTLTLDPHKGGMSTIPGGCLLVRHAEDLEALAVDTPYVSTATQSQIQGTRPGAAAAAIWAVHRSMGREGFTALTKSLMDRAQRLGAALDEYPSIWVQVPELNVVTFRVPEPQTAQAFLASEGLHLNIVPRLGALRVVLNPHVTDRAVDKLISLLPRILSV